MNLGVGDTRQAITGSEAPESTGKGGNTLRHHRSRDGLGQVESDCRGSESPSQHFG